MAKKDAFGTKTNVKKFLTTSDFLKSKTEEVEIPALGGYVKVRELPAGQVMEFMEVPKEASLGEKRRATMKLIASAVVDEHDQPLFAGENADSIDQMSITAFNQLGEAVMRVVGIGPDKDADNAESISGGSEGNVSAGAPSSDSPTV